MVKIERFVRVYEGWGVVFGVDADGDLTVQFPPAWIAGCTGGCPPPLLDAIRVRAALIVDTLLRRAQECSADEREDITDDDRAAALEAWQEAALERMFAPEGML